MASIKLFIAEESKADFQKYANKKGYTFEMLGTFKKKEKLGLGKVGTRMVEVESLFLKYQIKKQAKTSFSFQEVYEMGVHLGITAHANLF